MTKKATSPKVKTKEMNDMIKRALQEADLRFKCLDLGQGISKNIDEMKDNADKIYSYVFHLDKKETSDD